MKANFPYFQNHVSPLHHHRLNNASLAALKVISRTMCRHINFELF